MRHLHMPRLAALFLAMILSGAAMITTRAAAQSALGPRLQDASISGRGSIITIRRLPVDTPDGVVYRDITINLRVDASGALHVAAAGTNRHEAVAAGAAPGGIAAATSATVQARQSEPVVTHDVAVGSITETATPPEIAAPFVAGTYRSAAGGLVTVAKEGNRLFDPFPTWTLSALNGDNGVSGAEWYSGPLRTNPHHRWISSIGINSDAYSYGVINTSGGGDFDAGMLIGAVQNGPTLTLVSFHRRGCCTYSATPTGEVIFTRVGG